MAATTRIRRPDRRGGSSEGSAQHAVGGAFHRPYPGTIQSASGRTNAGLPVWVGVQHFFNLFLLIFIIRSGVQILSDHPRLYWTRHSTPGKDWFRVQKPVPAEPLWTAKQDSISLPGQVGLPGIRHSIGLARWWHLGTDVLWLLNGVIFHILLFATGQWRRVVPTSWAVFPNAVSVLIQYLSLHWPTENGWVAFNSLQLLAYFVTIFIAAPLALITGLGMSPALSTRFKRNQQGAQHPDSAVTAFPGAGLVLVLHRDARHLGVHDRAAEQPQPHLRRPQRRQPVYMVIPTVPSEGATIIRTPPYTPIANAYAERWVGTVRRELCDRTLIWNHRQLEQLLDEYIEHYNTHRPHRSLGQRAPNDTEVVEYRPGRPIRRHSTCGGLNNEYRQAA